MDSAGINQKDLFSQFLLAYSRVEHEAGKVSRLIPTPEVMADREQRKRVPTMSGRKRLIRGVVEEQLTEVEGIIDHLDTLTDNVDEASQMAQMLADAEPVPGAEEIDLSEITG